MEGRQINMSLSDPAEDPFDEMYDPPCDGCEETGPCKDDCPRAAYDAWMEERVDRLGEELAMLPDRMECYDCGRQHLMVMLDKWGFKFVWRRPVGLGPVVEERRDPRRGGGFCNFVGR